MHHRVAPTYNPDCGQGHIKGGWVRWRVVISRPSEDAVPQRQRISVSLGVGLVAALVAGFRAATESVPRDFDSLWYAARALLAGHDPYTATPGVLYPLPSIVAATPWALLSSHTLVNALCMFIGVAAFGWALMEHGYAPLFGLGSASLLFAAQVVQWTPILAGSVAIAPLTLILVTKPQTGLAIFCARPTWWAVGGGIACTVIAFALDPGWIAAWRGSMAYSGGHLGDAAKGYPYTAPVMLPGGMFTLLAIARWRRPEARLLVAMACIPQSLLLYETVPLLLVPRTFRESALVVALSYAALLLVAGHRYPDVAHYALASGRVANLLLFLPCTIMVLRRSNGAPKEDQMVSEFS